MRWFFGAALLGLAAAPLAAQQADAEREVLAAVRQLFDGMKVHDTVKMRAVLHPQARLVSSALKDGTPSASIESTDGWLSAVSRGTEPYDERISNPVVKVDGGLASVWMEYRFYVGERFSHCGVDTFHLVRTAEGWRIVDLADTRRREGCTP
jgi:hypothetical protein